MSSYFITTFIVYVAVVLLFLSPSFLDAVAPVCTSNPTAVSLPDAAEYYPLQGTFRNAVDNAVMNTSVYFLWSELIPDIPAVRERWTTLFPVSRTSAVATNAPYNYTLDGLGSICDDPGWLLRAMCVRTLMFSRSYSWPQKSVTFGIAYYMQRDLWPIGDEPRCWANSCSSDDLPGYSGVEIFVYQGVFQFSVIRHITEDRLYIMYQIWDEHDIYDNHQPFIGRIVPIGDIGSFNSVTNRWGHFVISLDNAVVVDAQGYPHYNTHVYFIQDGKSSQMIL
jgi:hypothetical protein